MEEIWKDIPDYEGHYQVSNLGRVRSFKNGKYGLRKEPNILKACLDSRGYYYNVLLYLNKKAKMYRVHQLVTMAFLGHKPDGTTRLVVDHINSDKTDNRLENLQIITHGENIKKAIRKPSKNQLKVKDCIDRGIVETKDIVKETGLSRATVKRIKNKLLV